MAWGLIQRRIDLSQTGRVAGRWGPGERQQATHGSTGRHIYKQFSAVSAVYGFTVRLHSVQLLHATF